MDETRQATHAKDEFFSAGMYVFHVTGFPPPPDVLTRKTEAPPGARLDVWRTDPASDRHIPGPGAEGVAFSTADFSLVNSGNRTLRTPKRSWKISAGMSYALPRSADGSIVCGTAEGVSWMAPDEVVMVSDKAKPDQDPRCRAKDQSIHIFRIPASAP